VPGNGGPVQKEKIYPRSGSLFLMGKSGAHTMPGYTSFTSLRSGEETMFSENVVILPKQFSIFPREMTRKYLATLHVSQEPGHVVLDVRDVDKEIRSRLKSSWSLMGA